MKRELYVQSGSAFREGVHGGVEGTRIVLKRRSGNSGIRPRDVRRLTDALPSLSGADVVGIGDFLTTISSGCHRVADEKCVRQYDRRAWGWCTFMGAASQPAEISAPGLVASEVGGAISSDRWLSAPMANWGAPSAQPWSLPTLGAARRDPR